MLTVVASADSTTICSATMPIVLGMISLTTIRSIGISATGILGGGALQASVSTGARGTLAGTTVITAAGMADGILHTTMFIHITLVQYMLEATITQDTTTVAYAITSAAISADSLARQADSEVEPVEVHAAMAAHVQAAIAARQAQFLLERMAAHAAQPVQAHALLRA